MRLLIDIGNTRTKWALADDAGRLLSQGASANEDIASASLPIEHAQKAFVSNVAGLKMAQQIRHLLTPLKVQFLNTTVEAYGLKNNYALTLGTDRWAALVAAWHTHKQTCVVVNAGTAITVDAIDDGVFIGGTIMPGLSLMQQSLRNKAALLNVDAGAWQAFAINTPDAIQSGTINAAVGAIWLCLISLKKQSGSVPLLLLSGGDAHAIAQALNAQVLNDAHLKQDAKQVIITENLVLQGLALLAKA